MEITVLESLVRLFQEQRGVTHSLWTMYAITTFTAAAFSFRNHARFPISLFVAVGYLAFAFGHLSLVMQSISSTNAIAAAIETFTSENAFEVAAREIASTANPLRYSVVVHVVIDICVCALIIFGKGKPDHLS